MATEEIVGKRNKTSAGLIIALMSLYFFVPAQGSILAAMGAIGAAFPDVPVGTLGYLVSLVALAQIPAAIISGAIAGRYVKYRTICIVSMILFIISGCFPYFMADGSSFAVLLGSRVVFGLALGFFAPLTNALVVNLFDDEQKRAATLGFGNTMFNVGAIVGQLVGGFLCLISWQTTFLVYVMGVIALLLVVVFLKEPERKVDDNKKEKVKVPPIAFAYMLIFTLTLCATYPAPTYVSIIMQEASMGNAALSGTLLSLYTVVGAVTAALFGLIYKFAKKWVLPFSTVVLAIGFALCYVSSDPSASSLPLFIVGFLVVALGITGVTVGTPMIVSTVVAAAAATAAMGFVTAFMNLGAFLATPYADVVMNATGSASPRVVLVASAIFFVVFAVILFFVVSRIKEKKGEENE